MISNTEFAGLLLGVLEREMTIHLECNSNYALELMEVIEEFKNTWKLRGGSFQDLIAYLGQSMRLSSERIAELVFIFGTPPAIRMVCQNTMLHAEMDKETEDSMEEPERARAKGVKWVDLYRQIFHNDRCPYIEGDKEEQLKYIEEMYSDQPEELRKEIREVIEELYQLQDKWIDIKERGMKILLQDFGAWTDDDE